MGTTRLPALGLEDTAERIEAACAAREPKVDPWEASLPEPIGCEPSRSDRVASALDEIADAMAYADGERTWALDHVRQAAAEVRAWRLSLPEGEQGTPVVLATRPGTVRIALRWAIRALCDADVSSGSVRGHSIRYAEACLRAAGEALVRLGAE